MTTALPMQCKSVSPMTTRQLPVRTDDLSAQDRLLREAVLYARVSSDEQEKNGYSIPAQQRLLEEYAARNGMQVVSQFVDVETAKQSGRAQFNAMLDFLRKHEGGCRIILVEKTDRLYRNLKDYVLLGDLDVEVHLVKEGEVLSRDSHSSQKMIHGIKVVLAKHYIDNLSEETKKGLREKAEEGIWPTAAPFGFKNVLRADGKKIIEPVPEEARQVLRLFTLYSTGDYSLKELCQKARSEGIVYRRSGLPIQKALVHKILRNRIYMGEFDYKGKTYQGTHAPIVPLALWQQVQERLDGRALHRHRKVKHDFAFSGMIRCGHCDCALVGEIQKQRYIYYHCSNARQKCDEPYVREEALAQKFDAILKDLHLAPDVLEWVVGALRHSHQDEKRFHDEAVTRLQAEYSRVQTRLDAMYLDKLEGRIDTNFYDRKAAEWRDDQRTLREQIRQHESANKSYLDAGVRVLELASKAAELFEKQPTGKKRLLLKFLISNCRWSGGELSFDYKQPFESIVVANKSAAALTAHSGRAGLETVKTEIWGG